MTSRNIRTRSKTPMPTFEMSIDLEKAIFEELTCPSCYNIMEPPVNQCHRGHNVCNDCFNKVQLCPTCRGPKSLTSRNYALESIHSKLIVPCKYLYLGCDHKVLGEFIPNHQKYCKYMKKNCPFASYDKCQWCDSTTKLKTHLLKRHAHNFYQKDKQKYISQHFFSITKYHYIFAVMYVYNNFFRLTWDISSTTGMTRWAVYFLGSPEEAKKYSYKLEFSKLGNQTPLAFKSVCDANPIDESEKFKSHNCFYIHKSMLDTYTTHKGDLQYKVSIYSLGEETEPSDIALLFAE